MQEFRKRYTGPVSALPDLPLWESELLRARGVDTPEKAERFLHPELSQLHDPALLHDLPKAVELIRAAIAGEERIMIYGDYDADGVCAAALLLETLREEGARADFYIPSRHSEGYGLNPEAVRKIAEDGYRLLITVDCGITSVAEVAEARRLGMTVIVTDHHEIPENLPEADAVLDPLLRGYPFQRLCGAGVALKICQALQGMAGVEKRIEIAALATVADVVPLMDDNRVIVREGLKRMERTSRPGLRALMENAGLSGKLRSEDLAFRLGPRINAAGRLEEAGQGVTLLTTGDAAEGKRIADHLEENNRRRQEMEREILREAEALLPEQADLRRDRCLILEGEGWNTGLIGLAAGKLCERFHHPVIVLSRQEENAVGSCRSVPGINIWEMLNRCADLFVRFGGHEQAAGLTIPLENIREFRQRLNGVIRESCGDRCFLPVEEYDAELHLDQVTEEMVRALEALEPTGCGNPSPVFLVRGAELQESRRVGRDGSHLKLSLLEGGAVMGGIAFGLGDLADQPLRQVDALFTPGVNEYAGRRSLQLQVRALRPRREEGAGEREFFLACLQEMTLLSAKQAEHIPAGAGLRPEYLLKERLDGLDTDKDKLRGAYTALRKNPEAGLKELADLMEIREDQKPADPEKAREDQLLLALTVFEQLGLLTWQPEPFRFRLLPFRGKKDPEENPLIRYLRALGCFSGREPEKDPTTGGKGPSGPEGRAGDAPEEGPAAL